MRKRGPVITTAVHESQLAIFVKSFKSGHTLLKAEVVINPAQLFRFDADLGPMPVIGVVAIRHQGVQAVITTGEFQYDQNTVIVGAFGCQCLRRLTKRGQRQRARTHGP